MTNQVSRRIGNLTGHVATCLNPGGHNPCASDSLQGPLSRRAGSKVRGAQGPG